MFFSNLVSRVQTFGVGGERHDGSDRNYSASSRGSQALWNYSTDADKLEISANSAKALRDAAGRPMTAEDIAELSEDDDEIALDKKIRGNITSLLLKKGWRVGRHPYVPECMDSLFKSQVSRTHTPMPYTSRFARSEPRLITLTDDLLAAPL